MACRFSARQAISSARFSVSSATWSFRSWPPKSESLQRALAVQPARQAALFEPAFAQNAGQVTATHCLMTSCSHVPAAAARRASDSESNSPRSATSAPFLRIRFRISFDIWCWAPSSDAGGSLRVLVDGFHSPTLCHAAPAGGDNQLLAASPHNDELSATYSVKRGTRFRFTNEHELAPTYAQTSLAKGREVPRIERAKQIGLLLGRDREGASCTGRRQECGLGYVGPSGRIATEIDQRSDAPIRSRHAACRRGTPQRGCTCWEQHGRSHRPADSRRPSQKGSSVNSCHGLRGSVGRAWASIGM